MFGSTETEKFGEPVKGKRYLYFTLVMIILLSLSVIYNTDAELLEEIANQKTQDQ